MIAISSASTPNGVTSGTSIGKNYLYALATHKKSESSLDICTGILLIFSCDVYWFLDLGSTLSNVNLYVVVHFNFGPKCISYPLLVSTSVSNSIVAREIYRHCVVSVHNRETLVDLIDLYMVDFDVIFGMNYLYLCYASQGCRTQKVNF